MVRIRPFSCFLKLVTGAAVLFLTGCVTPVFSTYADPPGVFIGVPLIPLEAGVQLRARM